MDMKPSVDLLQKHLEFGSQADHDLVQLRNKSKLLLDKWMSKSRTLLGMSSPSQKKLHDKPQAKAPTHKPKSTMEPEVLYVNEEEDTDTKYQSFRCPSAPPRHMIPGPHSLTVKDTRAKRDNASSGEEKIANKQRPRTGPGKFWNLHGGSHIWHSSLLSIASSHLVTNATTSLTNYHRPFTNVSSSLYKHVWESQHSSLPETMNKSSPLNIHVQFQDRGRVSQLPECDGCPVAIRQKLLNFADTKMPEKVYTCKCHKLHIPMIYDLEFDYFLHMVVPPKQLIVIFVVNSLYPGKIRSAKMLNDIYIIRNKNRNQICLQSRCDQYRILLYDIAVAKSKTHRSTPLLLGRHNAVPGMAMMYCGGRLVFADHIFNGYGNAKKDFLKQVIKSRMEYARGYFLPDDFRFTPDQGRTGYRAAWGGEMRGAGVNGKGEPGMFFTSNSQLQEAQRKKSLSRNRTLAVSLAHTSNSESDITSSSSILPHTGAPTHKCFETAKDFIHFSLSTLMYTQPQSRRPSTCANQFPAEKELSTIRPNTTSTFIVPTSQSTLEGSSTFTLKDFHSFARMQAVK